MVAAAASLDCELKEQEGIQLSETDLTTLLSLTLDCLSIQRISAVVVNHNNSSRMKAAGCE